MNWRPSGMTIGAGWSGLRAMTSILAQD